MTRDEATNNPISCTGCGYHGRGRIIEGPKHDRLECPGCDKWVDFVKKEKNEKTRGASAKDLAKKYGKGFCEMCRYTIVQLKSMNRWLEGHHVMEWAETQDDSKENIWVVCNACHLKIHHVRTYDGFGRIKGEKTVGEIIEPMLPGLAPETNPKPQTALFENGEQ